MAYAYSNRKNEAALERERNEIRDAQIRAEERDARYAHKERIAAIKSGANPTPLLQLNADTEQVTIAKKGDWRVDSKTMGKDELKLIAYTLSAEEVAAKYHLEKRTAFQWKQNAKDKLEIR
jgi:heterodisulfide reductase subunit B